MIWKSNCADKCVACLFTVFVTPNLCYSVASVGVVSLLLSGRNQVASHFTVLPPPPALTLKDYMLLFEAIVQEKKYAVSNNMKL
jgi:hypothetical protein